MNGIVVILLLLAFGTGAAIAQDAPQTPTQICAASVPASEPETRTYAQAEDVLEPGVDYRAIFCTGAGPIYVDLYEDYTPLTVNNFVFLAQSGYYNNTTFHRVMQDFMAQGGDPTATGTGGPGYQFEDEFVGFLNFDRPGVLAMANAGPDTNGSQFFITTGPASHLNLVHTVFGEVLEGQENVASIQLRDPASATQPGTTLQTVVIITDPDSVLTTYEEPAEATQEEVESAMDSVRTILDERVSLDESATGTYTSDQLAALIPEGLRQDYTDFLTRHNFQYRVASRLLNTQCDLVNIGFTSVSYTLDAYASRDDAAAALDDEFFAGLPLQNGYAEQVESGNLAYPMFTVKADECDREVIRAVTSWQRGRFVVTAETSIPADSDAVSFLDLVLVNFVGMRIYEPVVADVLRREIR